MLKRDRGAAQAYLPSFQPAKHAAACRCCFSTFLSDILPVTWLGLGLGLRSGLGLGLGLGFRLGFGLGLELDMMPV